MKRHHLHASPETCHWGYFDGTLKPVLTVASGEEVTIDIGLQIVSGHYRDALVLRAAARYAEANPIRFPVLPG